MSTNATSEGFSLHVDIVVAPQDAEKFLGHFKPIYDIVAAEPECLSFEVFRSADEPGRFRWVENWSKSREWFMQVQLAKEYYKPYLAATEPMFIKPRQFEMFNRMPPGWATAKAENFGKA